MVLLFHKVGLPSFRFTKLHRYRSKEEPKNTTKNGIFNGLEYLLFIFFSPQIKAQCDSTVPQVNANLLVANSMYNKILDQARTSEIVRFPSISIFLI